MLKFDLTFENEGILSQALADLVESVSIGVPSIDEPYTTDDVLHGLSADQRTQLAERIAARLRTSASHRDLDGVRSGRLTSIDAMTRSLSQKFRDAVWDSE